jgi:hypothetical protein
MQHPYLINIQKFHHLYHTVDKIINMKSKKLNKIKMIKKN